MKYVTLNIDAKMPIIGLGTWKSGVNEVYNAVRWAIRVGYRHLDCAAIYGNEAEIGQAIRDAINEGDIKREDLFITSKLWNDSHAPEDVLPALKKTLSDLGLDYLDLYLIHWPVALKKGTTFTDKDEDFVSLKEIPLEVTWKEMEKVKAQGLVKAIGVSNFGIKSITNLLEKSDEVPSVLQVESHPYLVQKELVEFCKKNMIAVTAYAPLGSGKEMNDLRENKVIVDIANRLSATPAQVLLAWQMHRGVIVIPKSVHEDRIKENYGALAVDLDKSDVEAIESLNKDFRFTNGKGFAKGDYTVENIFG